MGAGALEEIGVWGSQGGGKDKPSPTTTTFLGLKSHKTLFFFKPGTDDYTTNNSD